MQRRRSLLKDGNDANSFRHHRDRHLGFCISNEYYQPSPFFFTRESSQLNIVGQYRGASAFLILNGPSLVSGEYDLSLMKRPGVITYGVNNGPATFRPNFWSCVDDPQRFLKSIWLDPQITKFVPHAHAEKPIFDNETWQEMKEGGEKVLVGDCPNCIYFHRNEKFEPSRWLFEDKINWGNTQKYGGGRSVMLPAVRILFLLGFRKIYLMGADFTMSEDYTYHFDEKREKGAVKCNMSTYQKMKDEYWPQLQPYFLEEGLEVFNCNSKSGLTCFPYKSYLDAIAEATNDLGDVGNERTWGMYCKPGDKEQTRAEVREEEKPYLKTLEKRKDLVSSVLGREVTVGSSRPNHQRPVVSQEPVVRVTNVANEAERRSPEAKRNEVAVINTNTGVKTVTIQPEVDKIIEIPKTPKPPQVSVQGIAGERKLIKNLPFRG